MRRILKSALHITAKNWTSLLLFEMLYKVFCYSVLNRLLNSILIFALKLADISYLSFENISRILVTPGALLAVLGMILLIMVCTFFELSVLYQYCLSGWKKEGITLWQMIKGGAKNCGRLLHIKTGVFFLGFLAVTPFTVFPFSHYLLGWSGVPEFIMDFIRGNKVLFALFIIAVLVFNYIFIRCLFVLEPILLEKKDVKTSRGENHRLFKGNNIKIIGKFLISLAIFLLLLLAAAWLVVLAMAVYTKIRYPAAEAANAFQFLFRTWSRTGAVAAEMLGTIWLIAVATAMLHEHQNEIPPRAAKKKFRWSTVAKKLAVIAGVVIILSVYSETELGTDFIYRDDADTRIVAHRAGASFAPENTLAALERAPAAGADEAEIDVQQLRDKTLIIMHDSNFKRTAGVKKAVWDAEYSEVKNYDAGSYFSDDFAGEPIPTLEDMLKHAKNKIRLMIELKLTGHEDSTELVEETLGLISQYGMIHQCSIASMNLEILEKVKDTDSRFETVYITPLLFSEQYKIDFIDGYSVETTSVTREMVSLAQLQGKRVYGWTANTEAGIRKNLECRVDGLITDNPELATFYLESSGENMLLNALVELYFPQEA